MRVAWDGLAGCQGGSLALSCQAVFAPAASIGLPGVSVVVAGWAAGGRWAIGNNATASSTNSGPALTSVALPTQNGPPRLCPNTQ